MAIDINKKIKIKWTKQNKKYFENKGFLYTNYNDEFEIQIKDLNDNSSIKVPCNCDYCGIELLKEYRFVNPKNDDEIKAKLKISCKKCSSKKQKEICLERGIEWTSQVPGSREKFRKTWNEKYNNTEDGEKLKEKIKTTMLKRYGVEYAAQNKEIYDKVIKTNLERYGCKYTFQNDEIKEKIKQTNLERYDVEYATQNKEIFNKTKQTNLKRYGCEYVFQNKNVREKYKQTCIKKYGCEHSSQNLEIKRKTVISRNKSIYENKNGLCSKQQRYICNLVNGELNYPIDYYSLDIAFPNEMIYIEYDGGGHDLCVKFGQITQSEFNQKQFRRFNYLKNNKWKLIRIVSNHDLLPTELQLIELINESKDYLLNNKNNWIEINIDKGLIICSQYTKKIEFKDLTYIK